MYSIIEEIVIMGDTEEDSVNVIAVFDLNINWNFVWKEKSKDFSSKF